MTLLYKIRIIIINRVDKKHDCSYKHIVYYFYIIEEDVQKNVIIKNTPATAYY